jgi:hypothetical protein
MKQICLFIAIVFFPLSAAAQGEAQRLVESSVEVGVGKASVYDSYLSPLRYRGCAFEMLAGRLSEKDFFGRSLIVQHQVDLSFQNTANPTATAANYSGWLQYDFGLFVKLRPVGRFRMFVGAQADALAGFILNSRNGNNPAAAKAHVGVNLAAMASYGFRLKSTPVRLGWQIAAPVAGVMYAPEYGQSYYEFSLGYRGDIVHFASPANYLQLKNHFSADVPFGSTTLRVGYHHTFYRTGVNSLDTQLTSGVFSLGITTNFFAVPAKTGDNFRRVFD